MITRGPRSAGAATTPSMSFRGYPLQKAAWHEAGHVTIAFLLDAPVLHAVAMQSIEASLTRVVSETLSVEGKVWLYVGGAIGQYLQEKPKEAPVKAVMKLLRSPDANHDYLAAFRVLASETKSLMESRRILEMAISRAHKLLSEPRNAAGLAAVAAALQEASPNPLRGSDLKIEFDKAYA